MPTPMAPSAISNQPHHGTLLPESPPVVEVGVTTSDFDVVDEDVWPGVVSIFVVVGPGAVFVSVTVPVCAASVTVLVAVFSVLVGSCVSWDVFAAAGAVWVVVSAERACSPGAATVPDPTEPPDPHAPISKLIRVPADSAQASFAPRRESVRFKLRRSRRIVGP